MKKKTSVGWLVQVQKDEKTKEMFIQLPAALCQQMDLNEDDNIIWEENPNGTWQVTRVKKK